MPTHLRIADEVLTLAVKGKELNSRQESLKNGIYTQTIGDKSFFLKQEIVISDISVYDGLDINAIKLLIQIQQELKINNPLWECNDKSRSQVRDAIAQLKNKNILKVIGENIYLINPAKIRRGKPLACLVALYSYSKKKWLKDKNWRLSNRDIKNLSVPDDEEVQELLPDNGNNYGYNGIAEIEEDIVDEIEV